ncbi:MAG: EAL domain-containing protein [Bacillota bacterium]|nr:EAL domain-containing protein [Bacillota bacterium]
MDKTEGKIKRLVLVVDDEQINRELLGNIAQQEYNVIYASDGDEALEAMKEHNDMLSLVLLDIIMPKMNGLEVIEQAKKDEDIKNIPIIILTSEKSMEVASLDLGAVDFISKPYNAPKIILARMRRVIELYEDRSIIKKTERDPLTGLYNREFFLEYVSKIEQYSLSQEYDAVAINVDHFHLLNELFGRNFGDEVLQRVAEVVKTILASTEGIGCRTDADMFYIYCAHRDDHEDIARMLSDSLEDMTSNMRIRARVGVYPYADKNLQVVRQMDRANIACNTIKNNYTQNVARYDSALHDKELKDHRLMNEAGEAIDEKQFQVYYQPKYDVSGNKPVLRSAEALVKWEHPEYGSISPGYFVPLFEENGLIRNLDYFVWKQTGAQMGAWREKTGIRVPVSINVSRIDLYDPGIGEVLQKILEDNGLGTDDIFLEVTESAYAEDAEQMIDVINALREKGFRIEMDDFGSGYSSLNMLTTLPIDYMKLDMEFIKNMKTGSTGFRLVKMVKSIADYMEVPIVAEGVETEEQCRLLKEIGCNIIQGYYFSKPLTADEFESLQVRELG